MTPSEASRSELTRICRVSDMLCTGHAALRDRFSRRAFGLDLAALGLSTWVVALAFVEPRLNVKLTPFDWDAQVWIGALGTAAFLLTLLQMKTDWKGRSDAHKRTLESYAEVKREASYLLLAAEFDGDACKRVFARYDMAASVGISIPEAEFLAQKKYHLVKVALSKALDSRPSAPLIWLRARLWWRDTFAKD
jgi:hypothetical protein